MQNLIEKIKNFYTNNKQKVHLFGSLVFVMLIIIIAIAVTVNINGTKWSYEKLEEKMESATRAYLSEHPDKNPSSTNPTVIIEDNTLIEGDYLKELKKYVKDESCTGKVMVDYENASYKYQTYLTCKNYKTEKMLDILKKNNVLSQTGDGLYEMNNEWVYRGEDPNNYVLLNDELWRIVKIDKDNKIKIILTNTEDKNSIYATWDDRYNTEKNSSYGINNFALSRAFVNLQSIYKNKYKEFQELFTKYDLCYGKRSEDSVFKDGSLECNEVLREQNIGLLPLYDYMNASLDALCQTPNNKECQNYNYLVNDESWWTMTANQKSTYHVFRIYSSGKIESEYASSKKYLRYVLALNPDVLYKSGTGTKNDPYKVR